MRRRIGAVITHNDVGGAQRAIVRLGIELQKRDYELELLFLYRKGSSTPSDLNWRFLLDIENPGMLAYSSLSFRLACWIRRFRPDVLISFLPLANVVSQTTAAICGVPVRIASQRNPVSSYSWLMRALDWYFGTCGSYSYNICNSTDVGQSIENYPLPYRYRTRMVHNGVPKFDRKIDQGAARLRYGLKDGDAALVSIGRLTKQKNHVFLVQLLGFLENFVLFIAGDGLEHDALCQEAERMGVRHRVRMLGRLSEDATADLLIAADVFAIPSIFEGQSKQLARGDGSWQNQSLQVDLACHRETLGVGNHGAGYVIPITEPDRWISTLSALGQDPKLREVYSKRARQRTDSFSLDRMCSGFEACFSRD